MIETKRVTVAQRRRAGASSLGRLAVALSCSVCGARNYKTTRSRQDGSKPLEFKKFCSSCNAHTLHVESK